MDDHGPALDAASVGVGSVARAGSGAWGGYAASRLCVASSPGGMEPEGCAAQTCGPPAAPQAADSLCRAQPSSSPMLPRTSTAQCLAPILGHGDSAPAGRALPAVSSAEAEADELNEILNSSLATAMQHLGRMQAICSDRAAHPARGHRGRWARP